MALDLQVLGKRIQYLRNKQKISQIAFAELIDTSPTFVSRLERGIKGPSLETLLSIAEVLHVSIDELVFGNRQKPIDAGISEFSEILDDCSAYERFVLIHSTSEIKRILREGNSIIR